MSKISDYIELEDWVKEIIVDPFSKEIMKEMEDHFLTSYGKKYLFIESSFYDFRIFHDKNIFSKLLLLWKDGQDEFEDEFDSSKINFKLYDGNRNYELIKKRDALVYDHIPIVGSCIDVGGFQGRIREYMDKDQLYLSVDPMLNVFDGIEDSPNLIKYFPCVLQKVNFLCGYGEYLPIKSESLDTVHMRSCIDHMFLPELAILEAYRVLRNGGQIIIGCYVEGGKSGKDRSYFKTRIKQILEKMNIERYIDHHMWHPTYNELCDLLKSNCFYIDKTYWQEGLDDKVCYVRGVKK